MFGFKKTPELEDSTLVNETSRFLFSRNALSEKKLLEKYEDLIFTYLKNTSEAIEFREKLDTFTSNTTDILKFRQLEYFCETKLLQLFEGDKGSSFRALIRYYLSDLEKVIKKEIPDAA